MGAPHLAACGQKKKIEAKINRTIWSLDNFCFYVRPNEIKCSKSFLATILYYRTFHMHMNYLPGLDLIGHKLRFAHIMNDRFIPPVSMHFDQSQYNFHLPLDKMRVKLTVLLPKLRTLQLKYADLPTSAVTFFCIIASK